MTQPTAQQLYDQWREDYALTYEPNYDEHLDADCKAAFCAGMQAARRTQVVPQLEPVEGDQLPPVGSRIFIRHGRDDDAHACIVTGYYVWGDLKGDKRLHRVFVRMVYEGTQTQNARMLCDCYKTEAEALAAAHQPQEVEHPWVAYLNARKVAIHHYHTEGRSFDDIAAVLNLADGEHVERIYNATSAKVEPRDPKIARADFAKLMTVHGIK